MLFRSEFRFSLRLRCAAIFAPTIINRISIQTGKGISYPRGDVVVLGSWRVNLGLCIVLTAWFRCGFFCYILFILLFFPRYRKLEKANGCSSLVSVSSFGSEIRRTVKVSGHWCSRRFVSLDLSRTSFHSHPRQLSSERDLSCQDVISIWALPWTMCRRLVLRGRSIMVTIDHTSCVYCILIKQAVFLFFFPEFIVLL
ncbi:hypothetical protein QBC32DRAFT_51816 [Pseudoneurospora amorphoporcata]|uniref:Uncharacterized protein n=1 Tax=Pseudoneurospora amorphoporcata TaxID=241081 RepID=A0AAN6SJ17_9PEZI|nr:hypothetical protein QBC32DRAFT_51816 [Pseudoneurospora amorphoporcata]